jgi:phospholipase C
MRSRRSTALRLLASAVAVGVSFGLAPTVASQAQTSPSLVRPRPSYVPPVRHVFVINIENKGYDEAWGDTSAAPYLARKLRREGVLLTAYYGTAHNSLPNYIAQISGQAPNTATQFDCLTYSKFTKTGPPQDPQQQVGSGCVLPQGVHSLPRRMTAAKLSWKGYMQQMRRPCQHPKVGNPDPTQRATKGHNYAVRHNPFMYFKAITSRKAYCRQHVRRLGDLTTDLKHVKTTPNLSYITPDLCRDGHDDPCANGDPGGLVKVNAFMKTWAPRILASPAFRKNGMLVITADEADGVSDSTACCDEQPGPNTQNPGIAGPGGGLTGALVISQWTKPNSWSTTPYNHYSLLASLEEIFGLRKMGMSRQPGLSKFGLDVYNTNWWTS